MTEYNTTVALAVCLLIEGACPWLIRIFGGSEHTADILYRTLKKLTAS